MPYIDNLEEIKSHVKLSDIPPLIGITLTKKGKVYKADCPICGKSNKLEITHWTKQNVEGYSMFCCNVQGTDPIDFLTTYGKMDFMDAVKKIADLYNITIKHRETKPKEKHTGISFRDIQMKSSGIPLSSIKIVSVKKENATYQLDEFESGSIDSYGNLLATEDDMVINYIDLDGNFCFFKREKSNKEIQFIRARFKNPELHKDKDGNAMKYGQPYGSGNFIFIPEEVRKAYHAAQDIPVLFFEEGEKKAKKKSIHGMLSLGFTGIHGIARNGQLPYDVIRIIEKCNVKKVVFCVDADWRDITIKTNRPIDQRPKSFRSAIINFRDYFRALINQGIDVDIYVSSIKYEIGIKGVDDLLEEKLKGKESDLKKDYDKAMLFKEGIGEYVEIFRISEKTDTQIAQLLNLESGKSLALFHKEKLKALPKFKIGNTDWRFNENGDIELAQPLIKSEEFWSVQYKNEFGIYSFRYVGLRNFLHSRGFWKYQINHNNHIFVKEEGKILVEVNASYVRNYINNFVWEANLPEQVDELLMRGGDQYIGESKLSGIQNKVYQFDTPKDFYQTLIFRNYEKKLTAFEISKNGIEEKNLSILPYYVWQNGIIDSNTKYIGKPLFTVDLDTDNKFNIQMTSEAFECDYIKYLFVTSCFSHNSIPNFRGIQNENKEWIKINSLQEKWDLIKKYPSEFDELKQHFLNKITAFGFLLHSYRDGNVLKAVVCMDGKESEVGSSFGRSGKSIFADTFTYFMKVLKRNGKNKKLTENPHNFAKIDDRTKLVIVDDCIQNFDFEYFFPFITGHVEVNPKGKEEIDIPKDKTPKLIFTTNHAFVGHGDSFDDRQILLTFSDYFNSKFKPMQEFGHLLFDEWNDHQWNLFYNFCATALLTYFQFKQRFNGPIPGPNKKAEKRKLRQAMAEYFYQWALEYFNDDPDNDSPKLNQDLKKYDVYEEFIKKNRQHEKYNPIKTFKDKIKLFCNHENLIFNPGKPLYDENKNLIQEYGGDFKKGGIEYFHIMKPNSNNKIEQPNDEPF